MLGTSPQMQAVFTFIRKVAPTNAPVLILGESGTGKEMVAQALHRRSAQSDGPFVAINCNAIPENLLESELFGHEKGAFTGAHAQRKGHIETAAGGTLFLDEIGELPPPVQVKLLRFLQEKRFQRVGGRQEIQSDARVVAATNVNLRSRSRAASSARISISAWRWWSSRCPPCASAATTWGCSRASYCDGTARSTGKPR